MVWFLVLMWMAIIGSLVAGSGGLKLLPAKKDVVRWTSQGYRIGYDAHYTRELEIKARKEYDDFIPELTECGCAHCLTRENHEKMIADMANVAKEREKLWQQMAVDAAMRDNMRLATKASYNPDYRDSQRALLNYSLKKY